MRKTEGPSRLHRWLRCSAVVLVVGATGACSTANKTSPDAAGDAVAPAIAAREDTFAAETQAAAEGTNRAAAAPEAATKSLAATGGDQRSDQAVTNADPLDGMVALSPPSPSIPRNGAQIKRSEIALRVPTNRFNMTVAKLSALPGSLGGFVQSSTVGGGEPVGNGRLPRSAVIVMRIPSSSFDDTRSRIASYGTFVREQISGEEVSAQLVDLDARIASLRLQEDAYRKLFNAASKIQDIITVQERLTEVRTQIERITAERAVLGDQVAFSTVSVNLEERLAKSTPMPPRRTERAGFSEQVSDAWARGRDALSAFLTAIAVVFVAIAPFAPILAIVVLVSWWVQRRVKTRAALRAEGIEAAGRSVGNQQHVDSPRSTPGNPAESDSTQAADRESIRT